MTSNNTKDWRGRGLLMETQDELASLDAHPHYLRAYRQEEPTYWQHIPEWIIEDNEKLEFSRCLDIGSTYGTLALFCQKVCQCEVYCTDFNGTYFSQKLKEKPGINYAVNNIELDPLPWSGTFDLIVITEVLEHFNFYPVSEASA